MKKRALFLYKIFHNRAVFRHGDDLDLPFTLIAHRADSKRSISLTGMFRVNEEEKAARDVHRFNDESHSDIRKPLHIENVTDLFAVGMQCFPGVELFEIEPAVHESADERK